jgi:cobalt-precorrin 5A hydrolase
VATRHAGRAVADHQALSGRVIAIGIGCRSGASASNIVSLVQRTLGDAGIHGGEVKLVSIDTKKDEAGLIKAARLLSMPLVFLPREALAARSPDVSTRSARVESLYDLPSIAETAALAGAGAGSRLIVPRVTAGAVTCAIAISKD